MDKSVLKSKQVGELRAIAETLQLTGYKSLKKADLIDLIASGGAAANGEASAAEEAKAAPASGPGTKASADGERDANGMTSADRIRARRRQGGETDSRPSGRSSAADDKTSDASSKDEEQPRERQRVRENRSEDSADNGPDINRDNNRDNNRNNNGRDNSSRDDSSRDDSSRDDNDGDDDERGQGRNRSRNRSRSRKSGRGQDINFDELEVRQGVLDLLPEGYGFLRTTGYTAGERDVYVSQAFVRRNHLRRGDVLAGPIRYNKGNDKFPALARIDSIEGVEVDTDAGPESRPDFKDLTPIFPTEHLPLGGAKGAPDSLRLLDLVAPVGLGQRGLLVGPPNAGRTTLLKDMARAIETDHPDVHLMVLLLDERPEEVTDFERSTDAEVIFSTFDQPAEDHAQVAELAVERAKRVVERGRDVILLVDSLTRLARACNVAVTASGRVLSGGLDAAALHPVKRFMGAARNIEEGGSLTILATATTANGSALDAVIIEALDGTGNMQLTFGHPHEVEGIFPAVDVTGSSTRRDDLLLDDAAVAAAAKLRAVVAQMEPSAGAEFVRDKLASTKSHKDLVAAVAKAKVS